jgi:hypothetical protein
MSVADIINGLAKLNPNERSAIRDHLRELEQQDGLLFLHGTADSMFQEMHHQEAEDAGRNAR